MKKKTAKIEESTQVETSVRKKYEPKPLVIILLITIVAGTVAGLTYYFTQVNTSYFGKSALSDAEEAKRTISAVSKMMMLPTDEVPTVAMVGDITKLKNQPFFNNAVNGDKVLIFNNAKKAILWRPSTNMIIEVAPINVTIATPSSATPSGNLASPVSITPPSMVLTSTPVEVKIPFLLRNGTSATGLTKMYETELKSKLAGAIVVERENAINTYDKSILVDIKGDKKDLASYIGKELGIVVGTLPIGEPVSTKADFLIILGKDQIK
jgi:hypothetical protein